LTALSAMYRSPVSCETDFIECRSVNANNLAHIVHEIAPLALLAEIHSRKKVTVITHGIASPFREILESLGIGVLDTPRVVLGHALVWHACRPYTAYEWPWFDMPVIVFDPYVYRHVDVPCKAQSESLFVSRRGPRSLQNEAAVRDLLEARGFQTVYMDDYTAAEKLGLLSQARRIVAVHGAGLAPASLNRVGIEDVIELMPPHAVNYWFVNSIAPLAKRWAMVISEYAADRTRMGWPALVKHKERSFSVDVGLLEAALGQHHEPLHAPSEAL
jgi:hypothetical protein